MPRIKVRRRITGPLTPEQRQHFREATRDVDVQHIVLKVRGRDLLKRQLAAERPETAVVLRGSHLSRTLSISDLAQWLKGDAVPWFHVIWTPPIVNHLARHNVTPQEFEEAVFRTRAKSIRASKTSGRLTLMGRTSTGRILYCVFEYVDSATILPVTAYDPTE